MSRKYTKSHEWIKINNNIATIGISQHAAEALGELVYVELPEIKDTCNKGDAIIVVESSKSASDVYAPCRGEILEINELLSSTPENVNNSPYDDGWLVKIKINNMSDVDEYMNENEYIEFIKDND